MSRLDPRDLEHLSDLRSRLEACWQKLELAGMRAHGKSAADDALRMEREQYRALEAEYRRRLREISAVLDEAEARAWGLGTTC